MSEQQKCCQCFNTFNISRLPHVLGCSHNICQLCIKELQNSAEPIVICQFCQAQVAKQKLFGLPYNQAIKLDIPDQEELRQIQIKERCIKQEDLLQSSTEKKIASNEQICKIHKISMDIICINDKVKVCPHCALFGSHKNHAVRCFEDFQKELTEKCQIFKEIETQKLNNKSIKTQNDFSQMIKSRLQAKRLQVVKQINVYIEGYMQILKQLKQNLENQANNYLKDVQLYFKKNKSILRYQRSKQKFQKWQNECSYIVNQVQNQSKIDKMIDLYFNSPLQLVSQGYIYIEELNKFGEQTQNKVTEKIEQFRLLIDTEVPQILRKCLRFKKSILTPLSSGIKQNNQEAGETNPFLDCTSSQIDIQNHLFNQNTSMQAQFSTLTNSWKGAQENLSLFNVQKRMSSPQKNLNSMKEIQKKEVNTPVIGRLSMKSPKSNSMKNSQMRMSKVSQTSNMRLTQKLPKNLNISKTTLPPQTIPKPYDCKQPQKLYAEFMKNTLTDFFDLSDCNLPSQKIAQYVYRAKKSHKIKGLKLCSNQLTTEGFEKLTESLKGVCNINLANNRIDETIFEIIAKNRERIESLRILNVSHNPINLQKKSKARFQQIKRMGVIVIL